MSKHTEGPWIVRTVRDGSTGQSASVVSEGAAGWAGSPFLDIWIADIWNRCDANLIAAAPDLLAACKALLDHAEWMGTPRGYQWADFKDVIDPARAAITKAEGTKP